MRSDLAFLHMMSARVSIGQAWGMHVGWLGVYAKPIEMLLRSSFKQKCMKCALTPSQTTEFAPKRSPT